MPDDLQRRQGSEVIERAKRKILGLDSARLHGIKVTEHEHDRCDDDSALSRPAQNQSTVTRRIACAIAAHERAQAPPGAGAAAWTDRSRHPPPSAR